MVSSGVSGDAGSIICRVLTVPARTASCRPRLNRAKLAGNAGNLVLLPSSMMLLFRKAVSEKAQGIVKSMLRWQEQERMVVVVVQVEEQDREEAGGRGDEIQNFWIINIGRRNIIYTESV